MNILLRCGNLLRCDVEWGWCGNNNPNDVVVAIQGLGVSSLRAGSKADFPCGLTQSCGTHGLGQPTGEYGLFPGLHNPTRSSFLGSDLVLLGLMAAAGNALKAKASSS
ncbi:hypothetical protein L3X38_025493 [Prunus dulcis]|uniref:Uncharacterized protein n=1 Tax=Prunus dulcis TaxID=3755 RepID=A0AAD4W1U9_PRUDU|nr:hypothetical protein L3X38_025493 [Prunus dulcis]